MTVVRVSVSGLAEAIKKVTKIKEAVFDGDIYIQMLYDMVKEAEKWSPRFTGALEKSFLLVKRGFRYEIVANVEHASFTEFGTKYFKRVGTPEMPDIHFSLAGKLSKYPYLRSAVYKVLINAEDYISKYLKENNLN